MRVLVCTYWHEDGLRAAELWQLWHQDISRLDQRGEVESDLPVPVNGSKHIVRYRFGEDCGEPHDPDLLALLVDHRPFWVETECEYVGHVLDCDLRRLIEGQAVVVVRLH